MPPYNSIKRLARTIRDVAVEKESAGEGSPAEDRKGQVFPGGKGAVEQLLLLH